MIAINVEIQNLPQIDARLAKIDEGLDSLKPLWEMFGKEFYGQETALFDKAPWVPLSAAYAEQKKAQFGNKPILRATDVLFKSFTQLGADSNIHRINDLDAEFGSDDLKAMFHHLGTSRMPARSPLAEPDVDRYENIAGEYVVDLLKAAGFN